MSKKKPVTTKRGQHHQYKSFWINLIKDINLTKIDANVIRKHPDSFEKKKVRLEKRNSDPLYFRQMVIQEFQSLSDGVEFSFWRLSKDNPTLIPLPPEIDNATSLCNYDELNRSRLYIRLQAPPHFVTPSTSSTQPHQILKLMDSTVQQADDESSISQGTSALQVETGIPGDDGGKKQILNQSSWIVTHELGPDGELLLLPMRQASPTAVSITMQPTASVAEEAVANKGGMLELLAKEKSVDRGGEHSSRVPKKRKITAETGHKFMGAKQHQSSSAQERDLMTEHVADFWNRDSLISFSATDQAHGVPSADALDNDTGAVPGQFTQEASVLLNYPHQQLITDNIGFLSSLSNSNYHGNGDQYQPMIGHHPVPQTYTPHLNNGTWDLSHRSMAVSYPLHTSFPSNFTDLPMPTSYPFNVTDPITTPVQQNMPYPYQQRPYAADLTSHSIQQHLDSRMPQPQQPIIGLETVPQNASNPRVFQENASNVSKFPHAQLLGEIRIERGYTVLGIAAMNDKLYIACKNKDTVLIYSKSSFEKEKELRVNGMQYPHRISAYAETNCLFISDGEEASSKCIWMVKDDDEAVCEKLVEDIECTSLYVTLNGELLIVDNNHKCIHLYKTDGRCFSCVKLPDEIDSVERVYAVKSLRESFYVSAVWTREYKNNKTLYCMVYEVSKDEDILKTFGGIAGRGSGQLSGSNHPMAVDKHRRLIVGDEGNKRILMLDSHLQLLTIVLEKYDLTYSPWSGVNFYMGANTDLLFAHNKRQDISIFNLSQSQPNLMIESSSNISSRALPGTDEFHLFFSIRFDKSDEIRGVATLMGGIYVLKQRSITAYSCTNPCTEKLRHFVGDRFWDSAYSLWDIAADVSAECLYVTDKGLKCVWSVGIGLRQKKWLEGIGSPYALSVARDGSVLILSNKDQCLDIYDKDGLQPQSKIRFSCTRTMHLKHAVKLSYSRGHETYLVCYGLSISQDTIDEYDEESDFLFHELFVVSSNGDIIQTFGGKLGSSSNELNLPSHMVLYKDDTILVADCKNNRVLRLDHQLKLQNIPLRKDVQGIKEPFRLCYSENTGQMIVANSNSVDIFVNDDFIRCQGEDELSSSDLAANTDTSELEMPYVQLIGQVVDIQMQKDKVCIGAAVLQDHMYLIYDDTDTVYVHSSDHPYEPLSQIVHQDMKDPCYIVASVEHNCVYMADWGTIWRIVRNGPECDTFLSSECTCFISINGEGHLLVATNGFDDYSYVRTYDADGRCIQIIDIGPQRNMDYAVQLGAKRVGLFVNWKCYGENENCEAMSEVSLNGVILHTYGPHIDKYFDCGGMCLGEGYQIFVIDESNGGRILVFGSRARLIGVLLGRDDHQMKRIIGICYIKDKKQLLVMGSDRVNIYQLNKTRGTQIDGHRRNVSLDVEDPVLCNRHEDTGQLLYSRIFDDDDFQLRAMEKLGDKQYLLYSNSLEVISRQDLVTKSKFGKKALSIPEGRSSYNNDSDLWDIAASEIDLCLYVTDRYNHCVWSVSIDHKIKKWLTDIGSPYTLSVTEDGSLCILSNDYKSLDIYDRSGSRTKSIRLPRYMKYLLHAVQTPKGTYIISRTEKGQELVDDEDDDEDVVFEERHKSFVFSQESETRKRSLVCEISAEGIILRSFSANNSQNDHIDICDSRNLFPLEKPCHLALDQEGRVFVADYHSSCRVLLLDSQLKFLANLTENFKVESYKAKRLCYDKDGKELTVIQSRYDHEYEYSIGIILCIRMQCQ